MNQRRAWSALLSPAHMAADDRILPETRWLAVFIIPFLVAAFIILYVWPQNTAQLFAWTIKPTMTPMTLAAAYFGGIYFFTRTALAQRWHEVQAGFLAVTAFASLLGIATILHWDRFNHQHISFVTWALLYFTTPFLVIVVWLRNRRADPGAPESNEVIVPLALRRFLGSVGAIALVVSALLFLQPALMIRLWPWMLTPLTARVMGAMFALPGVVSVSLARERRWSAARIVLEAQGLSFALTLIAAVRARGDFAPSSPVTWVFVGGLSVLLAAVGALYASMEWRRRRGITAYAPSV